MTAVALIPPFCFHMEIVPINGRVSNASIELTRCYGPQHENRPNILPSTAIKRLGKASPKGATVFLDYFALGVLVFVFVTLFYAVIAIHDIPHLMGFASDKKAQRFLELAPRFEAAIVESGVILLKYFLTVSEEEQERRFRRRIDDPLRQWKLSPMDVESYQRWWDYTRVYDEMLRMTDSNHAPWWIVPSDDKKRARVNCISHILQSIPYERVKFEAPDLGKRQKRPSAYVEDRAIRHVVPDTTS